MEDRSGQILAVNLLFFILAWASVMLRTYVRTRIIKAFGKDDIFMLVTLALFTTYLCCQLDGVLYGTGKRRDVLTDYHASLALRAWFLCEVFYSLSTSVLKIAIGFFLLRITINPWHVWIIRILMVASGVLGTTYCFVAIFQCNPVSFWWDLNPTHTGSCLSPTVISNMNMTCSVMNAFADWIFGTLPIFIVKDLQMKTSVKVAVCAIIGFAAIGSAATIVRMPYIHSMDKYKGEFLYNTADVAIWSTVEIGVGIVAGNLATLKPLMKNLLSFFGVTSSSAQDTNEPWESAQKRVNPVKQGYSVSGQRLDDLRPANDKSQTTTTVTGRIYSKTGGLPSWADARRDSDEEFIAKEYSDLKALNGGISKSVEFATTTEERDCEDKSLGESDEEGSIPRHAGVVYERF